MTPNSYFESKQLREQRAEIAAQMQSISRAAKSEQRVLTSEEIQQFDKLDAAETELRAKIESAERIEKSASVAELAFGTQSSTPATIKLSGRKITKQDKEWALRGWLLGDRPENQDRYRDAAKRLGLPMRSNILDCEVRQQSLSDTEGGHTAENDTLVPKIIERLQNLNAMRQVATIVNWESGETHAWPVNSDVANSAEIGSELTDINQTSVTFTQLTIAHYVRDSGVFPISLELLQDSKVDLEEFFANILAKRIARKERADFTTGNGSSNSHGIVSEATLGKTCASTSVFTYQEVQDLEHSVDIDYRQAAGCGFMCHDTTYKLMKRLEDGNGNLLWQPNINVRAADTFDGYKIVVNNGMATPAASAKVLLCGDLSQYRIQDIGPMQLQVLRELYALKRGIGLIAYRRSGGRLLDPYAVYYMAMAVS